MVIKSKKKKTPHPNTDVKGEIANDTRKYQVDEYFDMRERVNKPISEKGIEVMAKQLVDWCEGENALTLTQFFTLKGIGRKTFYRLVDKYETLREARDYALSALGDRREVGGLTRKYDPGLIARSQAYYSDAWQWLEEWRGELRKKHELEHDQKITVVLEAFPSSDLVPKKRSDNE